MLTLLAGLGIGIAGSFHCIGMCGPLAIALHKKGHTNFNNIRNSILYNVGRVTTYSILGLLAGSLGLGALSVFQSEVSISAGIILLLGVIYQFFIPYKIKNRLRLSKIDNAISKSLGGAVKSESKFSRFAVGMLNGLLPCGLVYLAIASAMATAEPYQGGVLMFGFGLGTLPSMIFAQFGTSMLSSRLKSLVNKSLPYAMALVAVVMILRGMSLGIPFISPVLPSNAVDLPACCSENG